VAAFGVVVRRGGGYGVSSMALAWTYSNNLGRRSRGGAGGNGGAAR